MTILITGGAGYIGSHTAIELLNQNESIVILDDFSNSSRLSLQKVKEITGKEFTTIEGNVGDKLTLNQIFEEYNIHSVIHFAGFKSVSESNEKPLEYYANNIASTLILLQEMKRYNVKKLIFSSSATVYGQPESVPLSESSRIGGTTNPYGTSKLFGELLLKDICTAKDFDVVCLRYFNPIGAHPSGLIGESPTGTPNNLLPYIMDVAMGLRPKLSVFGSDYPTLDGTGIRDYIHVVDLARGHVSALNYLDNNPGFSVFNLGTGKGYSVLQLISAFEKISNIKVNKTFSDKRSGDVPECWADPTQAQLKMGWSSIYDINDMLRDAWRWKQKNPTGYN